MLALPQDPFLVATYVPRQPLSQRESLRGSPSGTVENGHGQVRVQGPLTTGKQETLPSQSLALHSIAWFGVSVALSQCGPGES